MYVKDDTYLFTFSEMEKANHKIFYLQKREAELKFELAELEKECEILRARADHLENQRDALDRKLWPMG